MADSDKINDLCVAVGQLEVKIDGVVESQKESIATQKETNGCVYKIGKLVGKQDVRIEVLEEKPSASKAVIWLGSINAIFIAAATLVILLKGIL